MPTPISPSYPQGVALEISGITVSLTHLTSTDLPRVSINDGSQISYTAAGVAVGTGTNYEAKHLWTINALCSTKDIEDGVRLIWHEHDRLRRAISPLADIWIHDYTQDFAERLPRTRVLAAGAAQRNYPATTPTHCFYRAKFAAWMPEAPVFRQEGKFKTVELILYETSKLPA